MTSGDQILTLKEAARHLRMTGKTLASFLRAHPAEPPLFAKPGRDYLISARDLDRIYDAMKQATHAKHAHAPLHRSPSHERIMARLHELTSSNRRR